jgi:hypothetical protein
MKRRIVILTMAILLAVSSFFVPNIVALGCAHCITDRNACQAACNGNAECLAICQSEYECCLIMCHGGTCKQNNK